LVAARALPLLAGGDGSSRELAGGVMRVYQNENKKGTTFRHGCGK